jgi:hypothetical protein
MAVSIMDLRMAKYSAAFNILNCPDIFCLTLTFRIALSEPFIQEILARNLSVSVSNISGNKESYKLKISGLPEKWEITGMPADTFGVEKDGNKTLNLSILANSISSDTIRLGLLLTRGTDSDSIPFTFSRKKF